MNTPNNLPPLPPGRTEFPEGTLDERIASAERRLVSREDDVRHRAQELLQRTQEATQPRRVVRPAVYALGAVAVVWGAFRLLRRRRGGRSHVIVAAPPAIPPARSASNLVEFPWVRAAALLWPLLPVAMRARMGPDSASNLLAIGVPLAGFLFKKRTNRPVHAQHPD